MTNRLVVRTWIVGLGSVAFALVPAPAEAHLVTTGLGPIYDGISHVLASPDDLVPILAMAMLAGLNGPEAGRWALFALTGSWLVGGAAGLLVGHPIQSAATIGSFLVLGVLTSADVRMSPRVVSALALAVGLGHGWLNGAAIAEAQREISGLAGIAIAIGVIVTLVGAFVASLRTGWTRIVVRVAGSWVAAIGLLMLGWSLRGTA